MSKKKPTNKKAQPKITPKVEPSPKPEVLWVIHYGIY